MHNFSIQYKKIYYSSNKKIQLVISVIFRLNSREVLIVSNHLFGAEGGGGVFRSLCIFGKLSIYLFPKPTLTVPCSQLGQKGGTGIIAYKSVVINYQRVLRCEGNKPQFQLEYNNEAFYVRAIDSALARDARSHDHSHACHVTSPLQNQPEQ